MVMIIKVNLDTKKIESYRVDFPYSIDWFIDEQSSIDSIADPAEFPAPYKGYQITDPQLMAKVLEARRYLGDMEAVLDDNDNLIHINITYPDPGEDR